MKPCSKNRKLIAWLALDALDANQSQELRAHLESCEGCRGYLEEMSAVAERLTAARMPAEIETSNSFHQRVVRALEAEKTQSIWEIASAYLRAAALNWRLALPVVAVTAVLIVVLFDSEQRHRVSPPTQSGAQTASVQNLRSDLTPTIANYRRVANQSLDKLDELLAEQANKNLPSAPIYTASTLAISQ